MVHIILIFILLICGQKKFGFQTEFICFSFYILGTHLHSIPRPQGCEGSLINEIAHVTLLGSSFQSPGIFIFLCTGFYDRLVLLFCSLFLHSSIWVRDIQISCSTFSNSAILFYFFFLMSCFFFLLSTEVLLYRAQMFICALTNIVATWQVEWFLLCWVPQCQGHA